MHHKYLHFEDLAAVYAPASSIVKLIDDEESLIRDFIHGDITYKKIEKLHKHEDDLSFSTKTLENSLNKLFRGEGKVKIPEYDGTNYQIFENIVNCIDGSIPVGKYEDFKYGLEAVDNLRTVLMRDHCFTPENKKSLLSVKNRISSIHKEQDKEKSVAKNRPNAL